MSNSQNVVRRKPVWLRLMATIMPVAIVAILASVLSTPTSAIAQTALPHPDNIRAVNGTEIGDAVVTWDPVAGAKFYRIGWLSITDFHASGAAWREQFRFSEVEGKTAYIVKHLTPEDTYLFIVGSNTTRYGPLAWPEDMVSLTVPEAEPETSCLTDGTCLPIQEVGRVTGIGDSTEFLFDLQAGLHRFTLTGTGSVSADMLSTDQDRDIFYFDYISTGESRTEEALRVDTGDAGPYLLEIDARDATSWSFTIDRIGG